MNHWFIEVVFLVILNIVSVKDVFFSDQIIFEAIRGGDWSSDIALDDVVLSNSACSEGVSILHSFYINFIVINYDAPR